MTAPEAAASPTPLRLAYADPSAAAKRRRQAERQAAA